MIAGLAFAAASGQVAQGAKTFRAGSAQTGGVIPSEPLWAAPLTAGSGTFTATVEAVTTLINGSAIESAATYVFHWGASESSVEAGGTPVGSSSAQSSPSFTHPGGLSPGVWYVTAQAYVGGLASDHSFVQQVTVT